MKTKKSQLKVQAHKKSKNFLVPSLSKKSQLKVQEMAFMLVAVLILFALIAVFSFTILSKNITTTSNELKQEKTKAAIASLASTPEFICPNNKPNCIDEDKLVILTSQGKELKELLGFESLKIIKQTGFNKEEENLKQCNTANYPNCDIYTIYQGQKQNIAINTNFAALCRIEKENNQRYERCEVIKIKAATKIKQ
mgnify:CR=1 FL=1